MRVRFTLVPGVNDDEDHVRRLAAFVSSLGLPELDVLPYRRVVPGRYEALGRMNPAAGVVAPGPDAISTVCDVMAAQGIRATVVERRL